MGEETFVFFLQPELTGEGSFITGGISGVAEKLEDTFAKFHAKIRCGLSKG
jgi:hypothetical protein